MESSSHIPSTVQQTIETLKQPVLEPKQLQKAKCEMGKVEVAKQVISAIGQEVTQGTLNTHLLFNALTTLPAKRKDQRAAILTAMTRIDFFHREPALTWKLIESAIKNKDIALVQLLLQQNPDLTNDRGETILHHVCAKGTPEMVLASLSTVQGQRNSLSSWAKWATLSYRDPFLSRDSDNISALEKLIIRPDFPSIAGALRDQGLAASMRYALSNDANTVGLDHPPGVMPDESIAEESLWWNITSPDQAIPKIEKMHLLLLNPDFKLENTLRHVEMLYKTGKPEYIQLANKILDKIEDPQQAFTFACSSGHEHIFAKLRTSRRVDISSKYGYDRETPLMTAIKNGHTGIAMALINSGALLNQKGALGYSALMYACEQGNEEVAAALLSKGATVTVEKISSDLLPGSRDLEFACKTGTPALVAMLIKHGADPNGSRYGISPIQIAYENNRMDLVTALIVDHKATNNGKIYRSDIFNTALRTNQERYIIHTLQEGGYLSQPELKDICLWAATHDRLDVLLSLLNAKVPSILRFLPFPQLMNLTVPLITLHNLPGQRFLRELHHVLREKGHDDMANQVAAYLEEIRGL